jgi:hypothetical protein
MKQGRWFMGDRLNPTELVEGIHQFEQSARDRLRGFCLQPMEHLVDRIIKDRVLKVDSQIVVERTVRWIEMYLLFQSSNIFIGMDERDFLAVLVTAAYKMLTPPELDRPREPVAELSEPLDSPHGYKVWRYCQPCETVGGDWFSVDHASENDLWTIVIDVTAHGYAAYITAHGVSQLWQARPIVELRASGRTPQEVLSKMSRELEQVLPDEVFVEAALARFRSTGEASIAGAGFCRVMYRRAGQVRVSVKHIGGHLLGCYWGNDHDQENWSLLIDDELTIASDGLYEQPDEIGQALAGCIVEHVARRLAAGANMHEAVLSTLRDVVGDRPRHDDVTVLSVLRHGEGLK